MAQTTTYRAGLYCRLSKDDDQSGESTSIGTQRSMMMDYCAEHGYEIVNIYVDDGYSGLNFNRPGFQALLDDIEQGRINLVITKDLSRLGRDYIMTGYYSEIYFPSKDVRYIAIADGFDSLNASNEIAPFKNILNDMYAGISPARSRMPSASMPRTVASLPPMPRMGTVRPRTEQS